MGSVKWLYRTTERNNANRGRQAGSAKRAAREAENRVKMARQSGSMVAVKP